MRAFPWRAESEAQFGLGTTNPEKIIAYASRTFTLKPGDLISTGTPPGVIHYKPEAEQVWLKAGDKVACSVEKLGELRFQLA